MERSLPQAYDEFLRDPKVNSLLVAIGFASLCKLKEQPMESFEYIPGKGLESIESVEYDLRMTTISSMLYTHLTENYPEFFNNNGSIIS